MIEDRRSEERKNVWFPMRVRAGDQEGLAISFDATERGLLIGSAIRVSEHDVLSISLPDPSSDEELSFEGEVVRVGDNEGDPKGLWPRRVAVRFVAPIQDLGSVIAASVPRD